MIPFKVCCYYYITCWPIRWTFRLLSIFHYSIWMDPPFSLWKFYFLTRRMSKQAITLQGCTAPSSMVHETMWVAGVGRSSPPCLWLPWNIEGAKVEWAWFAGLVRCTQDLSHWHPNSKPTERNCANHHQVTTLRQLGKSKLHLMNE